MLLLQRLLFRAHPIVSYLWKNRWILVCDTRYSDHYSPQSLLADKEYSDWLKACVRNGECSYVNIGAHIGGFDVAIRDAADRVSKALSVEMNPRTFAALKYNLAVNGFSTVYALNAGIAGERGSVDFAPGSCSLSDTIFSQKDGDSSGTVKLPLITLQDALDQSGLADSQMDLLKLDCEMAEYSIIRLATPQILQQFRHIIMEVHPAPPGESLQALVDKLNACGFAMIGEWKERKLKFWKRAE
jgi:FkbM family methyltransferase